MLYNRAKVTSRSSWASQSSTSHRAQGSCWANNAGSLRSEIADHIHRVKRAGPAVTGNTWYTGHKQQRLYLSPGGTPWERACDGLTHSTPLLINQEPMAVSWGEGEGLWDVMSLSMALFGNRQGPESQLSNLKVWSSRSAATYTARTYLHLCSGTRRWHCLSQSLFYEPRWWLMSSGMLTLPYTGLYHLTHEVFVWIMRRQVESLAL